MLGTGEAWRVAGLVCLTFFAVAEADCGVSTRDKSTKVGVAAEIVTKKFEFGCGRI